VTWTVKLSGPARLDIAQALEWTLEHFGQQKHDQYVQLIGQAIKQIAKSPQGPRSQSRPMIHADARTMHIARPGKRARHFFLYRMHNTGTIDIGRFLHDAMDLSSHLPEGFEESE